MKESKLHLNRIDIERSALMAEIDAATEKHPAGTAVDREIDSGETRPSPASRESETAMNSHFASAFLYLSQFL